MDGSCENERRLSYELLEANRLSKTLFTEETLKVQSNLASLYAETKADMAIVLQSGDEIIAVPYSQRFSPSYAARLKRRLFSNVGSKLRFYNSFLFVTLTIDHMKYESQMAAKRAVQFGWNRLLTLIRRKYKGISYIKTVEWQSNGKGCHLHILLCGIKFLPKDWLLAHWIEQSGWAVELRSLRGEWKGALRYILKYITKAALRVDGKAELNVSQIVNWATFSRSFSLSRGLSSLGFLRTNSNTRWVFVCCLPLSTYLSMSKSELLQYISELYGDRG